MLVDCTVPVGSKVWIVHDTGASVRLMSGEGGRK